MATAVENLTASAKPTPILPARRFDHLFFSGMALLLLATVAVGFARTYYLAGVFRAPLPSPIIHFHGAAFSCWILLLVTQASLVAAGRVDIHRRLGVAGFLLACTMVVLGILAGTNALVRGQDPGGSDPRFFYVIPVTDMLIFAMLISFAFHERKNPSAHKRLILIATTALMIAALARWPFAFVYHKPIAATFLSYIFLLAIVAYDLWSTRKLHRATLWAGSFLIIAQQLRIPLGKSAAWHTFAAWVQLHAR
jgi:FtsH-binding integral membrane protein